MGSPVHGSMATRTLTAGSVMGLQAQEALQRADRSTDRMRRTEWIVCEHMWTPQRLPEVCEQDEGDGVGVNGYERGAARQTDVAINRI